MLVLVLALGLIDRLIDRSIDRSGGVKAAGEKLSHQHYLFKVYARSATNDSVIVRPIHEEPLQ